MSRWLVLKVKDSLSQRSGTQINTDDRRWMLEIHMGLVFGHTNQLTCSSGQEKAP
jgi:hypothetical protein